MNPQRRRLLVGLGALPLAACTTPQFIEPPRGVHAPPRVLNGDRWLFETVNRYNDQVTGRHTRTVVAAAPQLRIRVVDERGESLGDDVYERPWHELQTTAFGETLVFERPMPIVPDALAVGARAHDATFYRAASSSARLEWEQTIVARGWERVRVPAGEFDALRIERTVWFRHPDMFRLHSERRDWIWYAPDVDHWVRREWTGIYYLPDPRGLRMREDWVEWRLASPPIRAA